MTATEPTPVLRKDYRPPSHWIDQVELDFQLDEETTRVRARLSVRANPDENDGSAPLVLDGKGLELVEARIDGRELGPDELEIGEEELTIQRVPASFVLETEVRIHPGANTRLMGLYTSSGNFCTQCEAQGFRRITYFLDRPDVMATYRVRIEANRARYPVLLSNGNRVDGGELEGGRHWVQWEDPFKKPSYLFALVAGNLHLAADRFTTRSGREVQLEVYVEPQNSDRCAHALACMKSAMKWDEDVFGLEYDLDQYMIVAVNDFNMGAMENKGLNVFNSKYVLAKPETATDAEYESIEGVIGHEYFHNWTGNRVTCRDWFQLTLKEGLTVFRDQQFSADMTSKAVKRIDDVRQLRTFQFAEDAGPMAHPIRPEQYLEMNNFYTLTVYEKGAEVIRMYHTLLGLVGFRRGMDLYFRRHDGSAVTCDDFRAAMADANGRDLTQFERWYDQPGTPTVRARGEWDAATATYRLTLEQEPPRLAEGVEAGEARPYHIPVRVALLGPDGGDLPLALKGEDPPHHPLERVLELTQPSQTFTFTDVHIRPVPSLLRDFSAPVRLEVRREPHELAFLAAHDSDPFNRWDAGQELARDVLLDLVEDHLAGRPLQVAPGLLEAFERVLTDPELDGSLKAQALSLPAEKLLAQELEVVDPDAIHAAREKVVLEIGHRLGGVLWETYRGLAKGQPYRLTKEAIAGRRLKNAALAYLAAGGEGEAVSKAFEQFATADNMTDAQAALAILCQLDVLQRETALDRFYSTWHEDPLVLDKWFSLQATSKLPDTLERVMELAGHPDFKLSNPNRARSLLGAFAMGNQVRFHEPAGRGYAFLADQVLALDALNPQVASRISSAFLDWRRFEPGRRDLMRAQLERLAGHEGLSKDVFEIVQRALGSAALATA